MNAQVCVSLSMLILAGCSSVAPLPPAPPEPVQVLVPVAVPCVDKLPDQPKKCTVRDNTRVERLRCILVDKIWGDAYIAELEALLAACAKM
jgi:hypothetical protein